jgi:glycerol-3-phosphate O-acyltransferase
MSMQADDPMKDKEAFFYSECLYEKNNFALSWLVKKVLSKVNLADQYVESIKKLAETGVVVYALKQKSKLNSLIIKDLSERKGIPRPVYIPSRFQKSNSEFA